MAKESCGLTDDGTVEHGSLYYKLLAIGHVWVHTISLSENGFWSPHLDNEQVQQSELDALWTSVIVAKKDGLTQLQELLETIQFDPNAIEFQGMNSNVVAPAKVTVFWAA